MKSLGATAQDLAELRDYEHCERFSEGEKAALAFSQRLTLDANGVDDALWQRIRRHFDDGEIIEIACAAGLFNYFNRVTSALRIEVTR